MNLARVGGAGWPVSRDGLIKEEKLQVNLERSGGICRIREECGRHCGQKKSKRRGSNLWSGRVLGEGIPAQGGRSSRMQEGESRGGARPGSPGPTSGGLCRSWGRAVTFRTLLPSCERPSLTRIILISFPCFSLLPSTYPRPVLGLWVYCLGPVVRMKTPGEQGLSSGWVTVSPVPGISDVIEFGFILWGLENHCRC